MSVSTATRILFDASCLIAAAASPDGGSGFVLSLCTRGFLIAVVSGPILAETEANLSRKFPERCLQQHRENMRQCRPQLAALPPLDVVPRRYPNVNQKDEHVMGAAVGGSCGYVLTLDRGLAEEINASETPVVAVSPKDFIIDLLPKHPWFHRMRD